MEKGRGRRERERYCGTVNITDKTKEGYLPVQVMDRWVGVVVVGDED